MAVEIKDIPRAEQIVNDDLLMVGTSNGTRTATLGEVSELFGGSGGGDGSGEVVIASDVSFQYRLAGVVNSSGWYTVLKYKTSSARVNNQLSGRCVISRSYQNTNNETYIIDIASAYSSKVNIHTVCAKVNILQLIDKIRVIIHNGFELFQIHYNGTQEEELYVLISFLGRRDYVETVEFESFIETDFTESWEYTIPKSPDVEALTLSGKTLSEIQSDINIALSKKVDGDTVREMIDLEPTILYGSSTPASTLGKDGDIYIQIG